MSNCTHYQGICDHLVCPREESRKETIFRVGDIVKKKSGKIRYEIKKIDADGCFHLSAVSGQGTDGYLAPHIRDICVVSARYLKGA